MSDVRLHEVTDEHFSWLLGERDPPDGLTVAPGGIDERAVVLLLRAMTASLRRAGCHGHWLMIVDKEVVGLCGFKYPPSSTGEAEIGYGVAESRRGRGYASQAVALMLGNGRQEGASNLVAETSVSNPASQLVLERNGFSRTGTRHDPEDGELILWARAVPG